MVLLDRSITFPPVESADADGLLAMGGDLSTERLLEAYRNGIFPWYNEGEPLCWWCPDPRFILFPEKLKVSKSMRRVLTHGHFEFKMNTAFAEVISNCKTSARTGQDGTWITPEVEQAYIRLHGLGYAHSAEAWSNGELVGGLYGIRLGNIFFGESMFSHESNSSKFAFINYVQYLKTENVRLIDCQVYTEHLESLGAEMISREEFLSYLRAGIADFKKD